ncbi:MAG: hypothetical protein ACRD2R_04225, partial [Terriglobales bacterium]
MKKLFAVLGIVALMTSLAVAGGGKKGEWTGTVSDAMCGAKDPHSAECAKKCIKGGSKMVFVNEKDKAVLQVSNPEKLEGHEGHK